MMHFSRIVDDESLAVVHISLLQFYNLEVKNTFSKERLAIIFPPLAIEG